MTKAGNKTVKTEQSPADFLAAIEPASKKDDCLVLLSLLEELSGRLPKMWGASIIGFGDYHYKYDSGREGDSFRVGFSPRAKNITIYIMPGYQDFDKYLAKLGKHKTGKSCLYINKLSDVDMTILRQIIIKGLKIMDKKYPV